MRTKISFDLQLFNDDYDFFMDAFNNSIDNTDEVTYNEDENKETVDNTEETVNEEVKEETIPIQTESDNLQNNPISDNINTEQQLSKADIENLMASYMEKTQPKNDAPEIPEEYQNAMEVMTYLQNNPELVNVMRQADPNAQGVASTVAPTPIERELQALKAELGEIKETHQDIEYSKQVSTLKEKYPDYDEDKVVDYAYENGFTGENNLENAYLVLKARGELGEVKQDNSQSEDTLRAELEQKIRAELEAELMKKNAESTSTTINSADTAPQVEAIELSATEQRMAQAFGMTPEEWVKYSV